MADIKLVIEIPEGLKKDFELEQWTALSCMEMKNALEKATPLPTGGKLINKEKLKQIIYMVVAECDTETIHVDKLVDKINDLLLN
jgi:hypothetical protein